MRQSDGWQREMQWIRDQQRTRHGHEMMMMMMMVMMDDGYVVQMKDQHCKVGDSEVEMMTTGQL